MGFFNKKRTDGATYDGQGEDRRGFIDVIQYNGDPDDLVWKFPYNNLSIGAQLIVNKSQEAIFVKGGAVCDVFGEGTHTLSSKNLPLLDKLINLPFGGRSPFVAEVWFVNKVTRRGLRFGTPTPIRVVDPRYAAAEMAIPVRAHGDYSIKITDSLLLLNEFVGTQHLFTTDDFVDKFSTMVVQELNKNIKNIRVKKIYHPSIFLSMHLRLLSIFSKHWFKSSRAMVSRSKTSSLHTSHLMKMILLLNSCITIVLRLLRNASADRYKALPINRSANSISWKQQLETKAALVA